MKLFGEKVVNSFTNSTYNILQVENFSEIFFDVYEVELNNGKFPVEKVADFKGNPVVMLPIIVEGGEILYPFVLTKGKHSIVFHEKNIEIPVDDTIIDIVTEELQDERIQESKQDILEQIEEAKKNAIKIATRLKKTKLQEANAEISNNKKILNRTLEKAKDELVEEFFKVSDNIKKELISETDNRFDEIKTTIDNKINHLSFDLKESLNKNFDKSSEFFDITIKKLVKESYLALNPKIDEELKNIATDIVEKVSNIEKTLDYKLLDKADKILIENVEGELNAISQSNIELNDKINKGVNKALSRVGNISTKVDDLTIAISEEVDIKISKAEENIEEYYTSKILMLEGKTFDLTENVRRSLIELISESKNDLITEIRKIKDEKPIEYIIESKGKREVKDFDTIQKDIDKKIKDRVDNEVTRLRKYISVYSGGGSVAMQFADGGTMNGNLTVIGSISASQYLGLPPSTTNDTLSTVTSRGNITTKSITVSGLNTPYVQFDTTGTPISNLEGLLQWNATDGTLDLGMSNGNITQQIGQELFIKVWNDTGSLIPNGTPVYFSGRQGNRPKVIPARSDSETTSNVMGMTTQDLAASGAGREGFITTFGYVRQIKTNYSGSGNWGTTWNEGDRLYVSKTIVGQITNVEPTVPHHSDIVGTVAIIGGLGVGSIQIDIQHHKTLEELSDVDGTPLSASGQFPVWDNDRQVFDFNYNVNDLGGTASVEYEWNYDPSEVMADPGSGDVRSNAALAINVTELAISRYDFNSVDTLFTLAGLSVGDLVFAQEKSNADNWSRFSVRSAPTNNGSWFLIPVTFIENGGIAATKNINVLAKFIYGGSGTSASISSPITTTLSGNDVTTIFSISGADILTNASSLIVAIDGALQEPEKDYTVNGNQITFTSPVLSGAKAVVIAPNNSNPQASSGLFKPYAEVTGPYTISGIDYTVNCLLSSYTIQLPPSIGISGRIYNVKNSGNGIITLSGYGTDTIDGNNNIQLTRKYESLKIQSTGTIGWIIL
jgi:hypothetical protein